MIDESTKNLTPIDEAFMEVFRWLEELKAFDLEAGGDVTKTFKVLEENSQSQFLRRTVVRNFAAHVEGFAFLIKQYTIACSKCRNGTLSKKNFVQLAEAGSYVDKNGKERQFCHLEFLCNFKFALKMYARVNGCAFDLGCDDTRYAHFREMIGVRHRLMHPKSVRSLIISDDEIIRIGQAWSWYQQEVGRLLATPTPTVGLRTRFTT